MTEAKHTPDARVRFSIKNTVCLWTEDRGDCVAIHAKQADGTIRKCYRLKGSNLSAKLLLTKLAREQGMTVRQRGWGLEAVRCHNGYAGLQELNRIIC